MYWAACNGYTEIIELLMDRGGNINTPNNVQYFIYMHSLRMINLFHSMERHAYFGHR